MDQINLKNGLLCALDAETYAVIAPHLSHRSFERGEIFYEPGDLMDHVHFPHSGVLSLVSVMDDGSAVETSTIGRESGVGLLAGLTPIRAFSRVFAQSSGIVSSMRAARLRAVAAESPVLRDVLVRHCDALLAHAQQSVACNALHDVEERFSRWLLTCHDRADEDELGVTQEFLAMMLGVQRTTVTQVAKLLQEGGVIRYHRGRVTITDRAGLERRACECYRVVLGHTQAVLPEAAEDGPCATLSAAEAADPAAP